MSVIRKNTLIVDFSVLPKRPDVGKVEQFLEKKVKLQLADTTNIQLHNIRNCVYVETIDSETALRYEKANNYKHTIVCGNKEYKIPVYVESDAVTVRVHDLPTHTQHTTVINFMQQYGVVISISRERWKYHFAGIYNGVRVLRMKLSRPIPSCVTIDGEPTLVTYRNQPKTCQHCGKAAHPRQKCANTVTTPSQKAPTVSSAAQLNGDDFPSLTPACEEEESNLQLNVTSTKTNEKITMQPNKNNNENNTTSDNGDDCGIDNDDDDGNDSSDTNDFIEATSMKRRLSKTVVSQKEKEMKKMCLSQGSQKIDRNSNSYQALVEIDSLCPSTAEVQEYLARSTKKNKKCNTSS